MILDDGLNVLPPLGFGVDPDEEVASPAPDPERGRRDETPATAPTAATPEEATEAGTPADSDADAAETTATDTATDTTEETE